MIDAGLAALQRFFSRSFILGTFFPVVLFAAASGWLYLAATGQANTALDSWQALPGATQGILFAAGLIVLAAVAYVVSSFHFPINRLYEGYWSQGRSTRALHRWFVRRQRSQWEHLAASERAASAEGRIADANSIQLRMAQMFPPPTRLDMLMPTRLGNVLRASELYPYERYRIDAIVIWPRLRPLLPEAPAAALVEDKTTLDALLMLRTLAILFGTVWPIVLIATGASLWLVGASLLAWPVAWATHRAALQVAAAYGDRVRALFDLYRTELLRHLGFDMPKDLSSERLLWDDLAQFYLRNLPFDGSVDR